MKVLVLNESYANQELRHWTNFNGLIGILQDDTLKGNPENKGILAGRTTVSFSRIKGVPKFVRYPGWVSIVFDAGKLEHNYSLTPFEYWNTTDSDSTERAEGKSEFEIALVLSDTIQTVKLKVDDKIIGYATLNIKDSSVLDVTTKKGDKVSKDENGFYILNKKKYKIHLEKTKDLFVPENSIILDLTLTDSEGNEYIIPNSEFVSKEIRNIENVSKYIKRVEFPDFIVENGKLIDRKDILVDVVNNVGVGMATVSEYYGEILKDGHTDGFNKTRQRKINHKLKSYSKFIKEMNSTLSGKISSYKTPSDWLNDNDADQDSYERNFIKSYYIQEIDSNVKDKPVFCCKYQEHNKDKYVLVVAENEKSARNIILPKYVKGTDDIEVVPFDKKYYKGLKVPSKYIDKNGNIISLYKLVIANGDNIERLNIPIYMYQGYSTLKDIVEFEYSSEERDASTKGGIMINI